jgi:hypothetical protein
MYRIPVKKEFSFEKKMFREGQILRGTFEKIGDRDYFKSDSLWIKLEYLDADNAQPYAVQEKKISPLLYVLAPVAAIFAFPFLLAKMLYAAAADTAESWDTAHV